MACRLVIVKPSSRTDVIALTSSSCHKGFFSDHLEVKAAVAASGLLQRMAKSVPVDLSRVHWRRGHGWVTPVEARTGWDTARQWEEEGVELGDGKESESVLACHGGGCGRAGGTGN